MINIATPDQLSKRFQISGLESTDVARTLALLLRAGSLAAPMEIIQERTIGPSLGSENIRMGVQSTVLGMFLVLIFMAIYYRGFGLIANVAFLTNFILIIALLALQATHTTWYCGHSLNCWYGCRCKCPDFSESERRASKQLSPNEY